MHTNAIGTAGAARPVPISHIVKRVVAIVEIHGFILPPLVLTSSIGGLGVRLIVGEILLCITLASLIILRPDTPVFAHISVDGGVHAIGLTTLKARIKCVAGDNVGIGDIGLGWI